LAVGNPFLVKDETTKANNGLFTVTSLGSGSTPWVLTRHVDADTSAKVPSGMTVYVSEGKQNADTEWKLVTNDTITLNTTALTFRLKGEAVGINLADVGAAMGVAFDHVTDNGPVLQQAFDISPQVFIPYGLKVYINSPIFLDTFTGGGGRWILTGDVWRSVILGPGLPGCSAFSPDTTTKWAFFINQIRPVGAVPATVTVNDGSLANGVSDLAMQGKLVFKNITFNGEGRNVGVAFGNGASSWFDDVQLYSLRVGQSWRGYADGARMTGVYTTGPEVTDSWALWQITNGDDIFVEGFKGNMGAANLTMCQGGQIRNSLGRVKLTRCNGIAVSAHSEGSADPDVNFEVDCSHVTFENMYSLRSRDVGTRSIIKINDVSGGETHSEVLLLNSQFYHIHTDNWNTGDVVRGPDLELATLKNATRIRSVNSSATVLTGFYEHSVEGIRIIATDSTLNTKLNSVEGRWILAHPNWEIYARGSAAGGWMLELTDSKGLTPVREFGTFLRSSSGVATVQTGSLTNGQLYEYTAALRDYNGNYSAPLTAWSVTANSAGATVARLGNGSGPCVLAIWRKTGAGVTSTADRYCEISLGGFNSILHDNGAHINGRAWSTTGIPAVPTVNAMWNHVAMPGSGAHIGNLPSSSPESVIAAPVGSIVTRLDNGTQYVKKVGSGNTGWRADADDVVATSTNYAIADDVRFVKATGGASGINVTLPTATAGRQAEVKKVDNGAGKVTIIGTVDGVTNPTLDFQGDSLVMTADGTTWDSFG